jgi:hypothetical protein
LASCPNQFAPYEQDLSVKLLPSLKALSVCLLIVGLLAAGGCGPKGPVRVKVTGKVKYKDGSVPAGEVAVIRFEPVNPGPGNKAASSGIGQDGSYSLTTMDPNDGAFPGDYKVTFTVKAKYDATSPNMVAPQYASAATTPLNATVKVGEKNEFNFEIEKAQ